MLANFEDIRAHCEEIKKQLNSMRNQPAGKAKGADAVPLPEIDMALLKVCKDQVLGEGGFGTVFAGVYLGEDVAIKTLKRNNYTFHESVIRDFRGEVMMLHILGKFPGIVRLFGANLDPSKGELCMVMERAEGSLDDCIYSDKLSIDKTLPTKLSMILDVARSMQALCTFGVFFRDAKPLNVLLFFRGKERRVVAKLTDFGLAKLSSDKSSTQSSGIKGTICYMAPELFQSSTSGRIPYSFESDVFAFGILFNEVMTEERPYDDFEGNIGLLVNRICNGMRPKLYEPSNIHPAASQALKSIIQACMENDPTRRPRLSSVVQDLEKVCETVLDVVRTGKFSVKARAAISLETAKRLYVEKPQTPPPDASGSGKASKKLVEMNVEDIAHLLDRLEMPVELCQIVRDKRINGRVLNYVEKTEDLVKCGFKNDAISEFQAMALVDQLKDFKTAGVPAEFLRYAEGLSPTKSADAANPTAPPSSSPTPTPATPSFLPYLTLDSIVGTAVRIMDVDLDDLHFLLEGRGGYTPSMGKLVGKKGILKEYSKQGNCRVEVDGDVKLWNPELVLILRDGKAVMSVASLQVQEIGKNKLTVGQSVTIMRASKMDVQELMQNDDSGLTSEMLTCLGKTGTVQYVFPNNDVRVTLSEGTVAYKWCRSIVSSKQRPNPNAQSTSCSVYCGKKHYMKRLINEKVPSPSPACVLCGSQDMKQSDNCAQCDTCQTFVCKACSTVKVGTYVIIEPRCTEEEMKRKQTGHGGYAESMKKTAGMTGIVSVIDDDGDISVVFDPASVEKEGGDVASSYLYNPDLVLIDASKRSYSVGTEVRIKEVSKEDARRKQVVYGPFTTVEEDMLGKTGVVQDIRVAHDDCIIAKVAVSGQSRPIFWTVLLLDFANNSAATPSAVAWELGMGVRVRSVPVAEAEKLQSSHGGFNFDMIAMLSKTGRIRRIDSDGDVYISIDNKIFCWCPALIELASRLDEVPEASHFGEYRQQAHTKCYCALDEHSASDSKYYCVHTGGIVKEDHWSCCGATDQAAQGCYKPTLPPFSTGGYIRIKDVTKEEMIAMQKGHGGVSENMYPMIGQVGTMINVDSDGDYVVQVGGRQKCFNPALIEDAHNHLLVPLCQAGHVTKKHRGSCPTYPKTACIRCNICKRLQLELDDLYFHCAQCRFDLCTLCSEHPDLTPVVIASVSKDELKEMLVGHGGFTESMENTIGKKGWVVDVDKDGDIFVAFDKETRMLLGGDDKVGFVYSPALVHIDSSRLAAYRTGALVRIKLASQAQLTSWQEDYGGFSRQMLELTGRIGIVSSVGTTGQLIIDCGGTDLGWSPEAVTLTNGVDDLEEGMTVKIVDADERTMRRLQEYHGGYASSMSEWKGKLCVVEKILRGVNRKALRLKKDDSIMTWNPMLVQRVDSSSNGSSAKKDDDGVDFEIVQIKEVSVEEAKEKQKGHGGFADTMTSQLGKCGKLIKIDDDGDYHVEADNGRTYCWNSDLINRSPDMEDQLMYLLSLQDKATKFEVGDMVRVKTCTAVELKEAQEGHGGVNEAMMSMMGKTGVGK
ncbi:hypothetical protein EON63_00335 [archaeon]|nr:MAG: hypothetical protein EON63_00335 [archaeon]